MQYGTLPRDWTTANVIPIYKKGDCYLVNNYRPISLTSIIVKVMERLVCHQLVFALEESQHISHYQFDFRRGHSIVSLLLIAINDCHGVYLWNIVGIPIVYFWTFLKHSTLYHMLICSLNSPVWA